MNRTTTRTLAHRSGAGLLAIGLAAGLSACTGAEAAPKAPAATTTQGTNATDQRQDVDMVSVFQKAFQAKTTAHITLTGTDGAEKRAGTIDVDNTGSRKAHLSLGDGGRTVDAVVNGDAIYAKLPGKDTYISVPMSLLGLYAQGKGVDITDIGGLGAGVVGKGTYQRTENADGESLRVYTVMLDLSKLPVDKSGFSGRSAVPVDVWLDGQERPRRVQVRDIAIKDEDGKETGKKGNLSVTIAWGGPVTVTVPAPSQVTAFSPDMLKGLMGDSSQTKGSGKTL